MVQKIIIGWEANVMSSKLPYVYDDGGRVAAGFKNATVGDCVCRSIVIATGRPYMEVYTRLAEGNATQRKAKRDRVKKAKPGRRTAQHGINTKRKWFRDYMAELGFEWVATSGIGMKGKTMLCQEDLPAGRLIVQKKKHYVAVIDGVLRDTYHSGEEWTWINEDNEVVEGFPMVYGYWVLTNPPD